MRQIVPLNSSRSRDTSHRSNRSNPPPIKTESSRWKGIPKTGAETRQKKKEESSTKAEERQDPDVRNDDSQKQSVDDVEYQILCKEIERIDNSFREGAHESDQAITLTSTFNDGTEISKTMHIKLMRLIKAMIPNSTNEQKDSFIRDLFDMGIRVTEKSPTRLQVQLDSYVAEHVRRPVNQPSVDEMMRLESNSIIESSNDDSGGSKNQKGLMGKQKGPVSNHSPYLGGDVKSAPSLDEYIDGVNSILESMDGCDAPGVQMASNINPSASSRKYIVTTATNSSDAVDIRWEQLRNKMLNGSNRERESPLTSEMKKDLIQGCVETGLASNQTQRRANGDQHPDPRRNSNLTPGQNALEEVMSYGNSSLQLIMNDMHRAKRQHPGKADVTNGSTQNRPGQPDDASISQPVQQRQTISDSFSIDGPSVTNDEKTEASNVPSLDEKPKYEINKNSVVGADFSNQKSERTSNTKTPIKNERKHKSQVRASEQRSDTENSKITADDSIIDSTFMSHSESIDDSDVGKLIHVKSSLTVGSEIATPDEPAQPFYQTVDLSESESLQRNHDMETPKKKKMPPSWRLSPAESLSDFMLTVLSAEIGTATNYYVHKHVMAIGPRSSQYMNDVFASENTSNFQVTLDGKTFELIPEILDFMYCQDYEITMTTDNAVALRQLAKMLKITPLEAKAAKFILEDMGINNLVTYVSDCCYFNDVEVTKAVVRKCIANIASISVSDRLWVVMEPELFLQIVSSPCIDRNALSKHLSLLLREYLDLHQYEIDCDLFTTLTSKSIIPIVDRAAALPLIELSESYESKDCVELQKRCAFTAACYWQTTPAAERQRLFALLRNLPSSLTVDFLEAVDSGNKNLEMLRSEMEHHSINDNPDSEHMQDALTVEDFYGDAVISDCNQEILSWRMSPEKSYSDMSIRVKYSNHEGSQIYHVHKHIVAVGPNRSDFLADHLNANKIKAGEKVCIVVELDSEGASAVPMVLDFLYSQDTNLRISNENSVPLHYVSRTFRISALNRKITRFIKQDMSLENVVYYIADGAYYRDHMTIATAGRLCAQELSSIDVESNLLSDLEPEFFEKIVSCDVIELEARSRVNVLIAKYFLIHNLEGTIVEKLLDSVYVDQINKDSAVHLLKILIMLDYKEGVETFGNMKKKSIDVITENWAELTVDSQQREELFLILPSFHSDVITNMFKIIDSKTRVEYNEVMSRYVELEKHCEEEIAEVNRVREWELSSLNRELELRTSKMLELQKELEDKLIQVDRALAQQAALDNTLDNADNSRALANTSSEFKELATFPTSSSDQNGATLELGSRDHQSGVKSNDSDVSIKIEDVNSDQQSVNTTQVQKKGRIFC